jgi:hypothetical protein
MSATTQTTRARGSYTHPNGKTVSFSTDRGTTPTWAVYYSYVDGYWISSATTEDPAATAAAWATNGLIIRKEQIERDGFHQLPRLAFCPVVFDEEVTA